MTVKRKLLAICYSFCKISERERDSVGSFRIVQSADCELSLYECVRAFGIFGVHMFKIHVYDVHTKQSIYLSIDIYATRNSTLMNIWM